MLPDAVVPLPRRKTAAPASRRTGLRELLRSAPSIPPWRSRAGDRQDSSGRRRPTRSSRSRGHGSRSRRSTWPSRRRPSERFVAGGARRRRTGGHARSRRGGRASRTRHREAAIRLGLGDRAPRARSRARAEPRRSADASLARALAANDEPARPPRRFDFRTCPRRSTPRTACSIRPRICARGRYISPILLALTANFAKDMESLFIWLNVAYDERSVQLPYLLRSPELPQSDPRLIQLIRRLKLPATS